MKWRGSYTVEAAVIIPVLIWTMAAAMCTGIDLLHEVREEHEEKQIEDMWAVDSFYQYQTLKEVKKMINREIVYERNLTGSFMKIAAGIHAGLDEKLMLRRKIAGTSLRWKRHIWMGRDSTGITYPANSRLICIAG